MNEHEHTSVPMVADFGQPITMSSREIADLVEKRHDNVKRTVETLAAKGVIGHPQFEDDLSTDAQGKDRVTKVYHLCKRDSFVVVAQLSPEFTARLVDRWQELEREKQSGGLDPMRALNDPATMRGLLLSYSEKVLALESKVGAMEPKVQALERIAQSDGSFCVTDAAKTLQVRPKALFQFLRSQGWIYSRGGGGRGRLSGQARQIGRAHV